MKPQRCYDLLEAFPEAGCPVCQILQTTTERFITYLLTDRVMDEATYEALRARRGLCNAHISNLAQRRGIVSTLALFYSAAMDELVRLMEEMPPPAPAQSGWRKLLIREPDSGAALADRLEPVGPCLICADMQEQETWTIQILCEYLADSSFREAYELSQGLCIPHLQQALRHAQDAKTIEALITHQRAVWARGKAELDEFASKLNFSRRDEEKGHEGGSLNRAIGWTSGLQGIFGLDPRKRHPDEK